MRTSPAPGFGRSTSSIVSGFLNSRRTAAFIQLISCALGSGRGFRWTAISKGSQSRLDGTNEEFHGAVHPLRQFMRPRKVHSPLPNHGRIQPFHELGEVDNRKVASDLAGRLALIENLAEQPDR